ncbi:hypothetical protein V1478_005012 [Vespula squamosa]|uniref:Uncharacterized protein n=1 Tax=Vespula squamosa TaxID=30214 RepID=A0ABD2BFD8_VESSQ
MNDDISWCRLMASCLSYVRENIILYSLSFRSYHLLVTKRIKSCDIIIKEEKTLYRRSKNMRFQEIGINFCKF